MTTASDDILARKERYNRIERATDGIGRMIGVRRLKPSQQLRVQEMAPGLDGTIAFTEESSGKSFDIPRNSPLIIAASVCEIDSAPIPFPKSRAELDAVLDRLDSEGLEAAGAALAKFAADSSEVDVKEAAKN
jgi:hypothetical protein